MSLSVPKWFADQTEVIHRKLEEARKREAVARVEVDNLLRDAHQLLYVLEFEALSQLQLVEPTRTTSDRSAIDEPTSTPLSSTTSSMSDSEQIDN